MTRRIAVSRADHARIVADSPVWRERTVALMRRFNADTIDYVASDLVHEGRWAVLAEEDRHE
jgi:transglutaminase-like putative cysteine protease